MKTRVVKFEEKNDKIKTFKDILMEYSKEERLKILSNLSNDDLLLLKSRYGERFSETLESDVDTIKKISDIIFSKIPLILEGEINMETKEIDSNLLFLLEDKKEESETINEEKNTVVKKRKRGLSLREIFKEKYDEELFDEVIKSLPIEDLEVLRKRYGENLDQVLEVDSDVLKRSRTIIYQKIPTRVKLVRENTFKEARGIKTTEKVKKVRKNLSFIDSLKKKYSDSEVELIIKTLSEKDLEILRQRYGENLDQVLDTDEGTKSRSTVILYQKIPRKVKILRDNSFKKMVDINIREEVLKNSRKVALSLREIFKEKYGEELFDEVIKTLPLEDLEILKQRYGENLDQVLEVDSDVLKRSRTIIYQKIPNRVKLVRKQLSKETRETKINEKEKRLRKGLSFIDSLKKKYSDKEIDFIIKSLSEKDLEVLRQRYGENLDQVLDTDEEIKNRSKVILYQKVPSKVKLLKDDSLKTAVGINPVVSNDDSLDDNLFIKLKPHLIGIRNFLDSIINAIEKRDAINQDKEVLTKTKK